MDPLRVLSVSYSSLAFLELRPTDFSMPDVVRAHVFVKVLRVGEWGDELRFLLLHDLDQDLQCFPYI